MALQERIVIISLLTLLLVFFTLIPACTSLSTAYTPHKTFGMLTGTIHYPNNLYFPARIRIEITLSLVDENLNAQRVLVNQTIRNPQRFPVNFTLRYDMDEIDSLAAYMVEVALFHEGATEPFLISTQPIITQLQSDVNSLNVQLKAVSH